MPNIALKLENYNSFIDIYKKHIQLARYLNISPKQYIIQQNKFEELATAMNQSEQYLSSIEYHLKTPIFPAKTMKLLMNWKKYLLLCSSMN